MLNKKITKFLSTLFVGGICFTGLNHVNAVNILRSTSSRFPEHIVSFQRDENNDLVETAYIYHRDSCIFVSIFEQPVSLAAAKWHVFSVVLPKLTRPATPPEVEKSENDLGMQIKL